MSQPNDILDAIRNANTQSGQFGITAIIAALVTSTVISTIVFIIFSVLRPRHKIVYAPKVKHAKKKSQEPPPIDDGLFSWLKPVWRCTDEDLLDKIGLDAVLFLRFWRMCRNIFICLGIGSAVIIPFNIIVGLKTVGGQANVARDKYYPIDFKLIVVRWGYCPLKELLKVIFGCKSYFLGYTLVSSFSGYIKDTLE